MDADATSDPKFEIGHVLFVDIVGYSKLLIGEQSELVHELKEVVATSEQVRVAEEQSKLVSLPTGDGVALVFRDLIRKMVTSTAASNIREPTGKVSSLVGEAKKKRPPWRSRRPNARSKK